MNAGTWKGRCKIGKKNKEKKTHINKQTNNERHKTRNKKVTKKVRNTETDKDRKQSNKRHKKEMNRNPGNIERTKQT
jgi:hypothetical protein